MAKVAQDNTVVVTWANYHYRWGGAAAGFRGCAGPAWRAAGPNHLLCVYASRHAHHMVCFMHRRDFVMNWVEHLRATGCTAFIVGAMDDKLLDFLVAQQVPTFSMSSGLTLDDFGWGSPTFHKMGREKVGRLRTASAQCASIQQSMAVQRGVHAGGGMSAPHCCWRCLLLQINLIYSFTKMGFDVLISDVDTVWLRDPLPYMRQVGAPLHARSSCMFCLPHLGRHALTLNRPATLLLCPAVSGSRHPHLQRPPAQHGAG